MYSEYISNDEFQRIVNGVLLNVSPKTLRQKAREDFSRLLKNYYETLSDYLTFDFIESDAFLDSQYELVSMIHNLINTYVPNKVDYRSSYNEY